MNEQNSIDSLMKQNIEAPFENEKKKVMVNSEVEETKVEVEILKEEPEGWTNYIYTPLYLEKCIKQPAFVEIKGEPLKIEPITRLDTSNEDNARILDVMWPQEFSKSIVDKGAVSDVKGEYFEETETCFQYVNETTKQPQSGIPENLKIDGIDDEPCKTQCNHSKEFESMILMLSQNMSDNDNEVIKNNQNVNYYKDAGPSKMFDMCAQSLPCKTQSTDSNTSTQMTQEIYNDIVINVNNDPGASNMRPSVPVKVDHKAAERSRLYRERHREEINERRRLMRQHKKATQQIHTVSNVQKINEIEQITDASSSNQRNSHRERQQRYYERHKEELNKRKRDRRLQRLSQSIPVSPAERNRNYRARNREIINEQRRESRRRQKNVQSIQTESY